MKQPCGCCTGIELVTPQDVTNRPGLPALSYRAGNHATFLESMLARLSSLSDPEFGNPLTGLRTRDLTDPSIAFLDAWAVVADVLTFYQERIANEGYLRTAIERRSVVELARLIGYKPRPGVASSVYLAFTLQSGFDVTIPAGTAAKTTPGPGQLPQTFETSGPIEARAEWNQLVPRRTLPQSITQQNANDILTIWFAGTSTKLKPNDRLLLVFGNLQDEQVIRRVASIYEDQQNKRTQVTLQVEAYSAVAFAQALLGIIQRRIQVCPDLADSASLKTFQGQLQTSNPLLDLDQDADQAKAGLAAEKATKGSSKQNLDLLATAAGAMARGLSQTLGTPNAGLAARLGGTITAYFGQEANATQVDQALRSFQAAVAAGGKNAPQVKALLAADAGLQAQGVQTAEYTVLAAAIGKLHTAWQPSIADIASSANEALTQVQGIIAHDLTLAAPADVALLAQLQTIQTNIASALTKTSADQTAEMEDAAAALAGSAPVLPQLQTDVTKILNTLKDGLGDISSDLDDASTALGAHQDLILSLHASQAIATVHQKAQTLATALPAAALSAQVSAWQTAIAAVNAVDTSGLVLFASRVNEFSTALVKSPGDVVQKALVSVLDGIPLPANLPAGSTEQADEDALNEVVQPVRDATDPAGAVAAAEAALPGLTAEKTSIESDSKAASDEQACYQDTIDALAAGQLPFRQNFVLLFRNIASRFAQALPPNNVQVLLAVAALRTLETAIANLGAPPLATLVNIVSGALTTIKADHKQVTADNHPIDDWFTAFETEIGSVIGQISTAQSAPVPPAAKATGAFDQLGDIVGKLLEAPQVYTTAPANLKTAFTTGSDAVARSLLVLQPSLGNQVFEAWGQASVNLPLAEVHAFRARAPLFGYNAPKIRQTAVTPGDPATFKVTEDGDPSVVEVNTQVSLDASYDQVISGSWVVVQPPASAGAMQTAFARAMQVNSGIGIARYGMTGKTTRITLANPADSLAPATWFANSIDFPTLREMVVYAQSEQLALAEAPIADPVGPPPSHSSTGTPVTGDKITLDGYYDGLKSGRFVVVNGERTDLAGVVNAELSLVAAVTQDLNVNLPGDTLHTTLQFAAPLQHQYKRETVKINANVAEATHGQTQKEVLGSGGGSQTFQSFNLSHLPLTYLSEATPSGAESTLQVRVNDILWHEADNIEGLGPKDRQYVIDIEDDGTTSVIFGDGVHGARLPTGTENVRAVYRSGIGSPGNVDAGNIGILPSPPLGASAVNNPAPATGGADPETLDQARANAPLAVMALDRLVSVQDYADFARTYAGIAKAASSLAAGTVTVTIAGIDDIPIDPTSDLFVNLTASLEQFGDPHQPVALELRTLKILVLQAGVAIDPDYDWDVVNAQIRSALLAQFGFDARQLGQDAVLSQVIAAVQDVAGVLYLDVEHFGFIPQTKNPQEVVDAIGALEAPSQRLVMAPGEISCFSPDLPETIALNQITPEQD